MDHCPATPQAFRIFAYRSPPIHVTLLLHARLQTLSADKPHVYIQVWVKDIGGCLSVLHGIFPSALDRCWRFGVDRGDKIQYIYGDHALVFLPSGTMYMTRLQAKRIPLTDS